MLIAEGQRDALLVPAHVAEIIVELAAWANKLNVEVLDMLNKRIYEKERK
jgi:hypothetical protein